MGRQESSPPRQRHRMPHHRRHHHHHNHYSDAQATNGKSPLSLGRLNRVSHAPNSHAIVESWLGQVIAPAPTRRLVSPEPRNQPVHHRKRPRSRDSDDSPCRRHPRLVDPLWRPQHTPPAQGPSSPPLPLTTNRERNLKRYKQNSHDSSLISELSRRQELWRWDRVENPSGHEESSRYKPLDEAEGDTAGVSSPMSRIGEVPAFEKRPRNKTRADKYNTMKLDGSERRKKTLDQGEHRPRRSKSKKRKHIATGKNVMDNFTSGAVVNDRITPNLKPGLFNNKRVSKKHPVTDLSFSEMRFLSHQEREVPQQTGLSSSRLRRESRELEQISSFFQPTCADKALHKAKPTTFKDSKGPRGERLAYRDGPKSAFYRDSFANPSSPTALTRSHREQSLISPGNLGSLPTATPSNPDYRPDSCRTTTYFTWSSSHHSPPAKQYRVDTRPNHVEPARSATPESTRKALVATGVYRDTGIRPYDVSNDEQQNHILKTRGESTSASSGIVSREDTYKDQALAADQKSEMKLRHTNDTRDTAALPAYLEERWNIILPPGWRSRRSLEAEDSSVDEQRAGATPGISLSTRPPSRQEIVQEAQIRSMRKPLPVPCVCSRGEGNCGPNRNSTTKSPVSVPQETEKITGHEIPAAQDRASLASRDAMPPPPIPLPRCNSLNVTNPRLRDHLSSFTRPATVRPLETLVQMSHFKPPQLIDTYTATGQPHEPSRKTEKVIPTLDSASWIPQAATPPIASYERHRALSRLSTRSPIYESQDRDKESHRALRPVPPRTAHMTESMADFIARIESEVEKQISLDDYCEPESAVADQELLLDLRMSAYNAQNQQLAMSDGSQGDCIQPPVGLINDLASTGAFEMGNDFHNYEELGTSVRGESIMMPIEGARDDTDEFLEMSSFWRPNQFSHF